MMMTDMLFGSRCLRMMKLGEAPIERAAKNVFLLFERKDLAPNQTGHADPIKKGEDDENRDHAAPKLAQEPGCGAAEDFMQNDRNDNDENDIRKRINDIDDTHHDHIDLAAEETGD
jgi:hypothetical protein